MLENKNEWLIKLCVKLLFAKCNNSSEYNWWCTCFQRWVSRHT